jgi:8-oxo-dGTP diphosphatase
MPTRSKKILPSNQNPHVSVDCVIFGFDAIELKVLLIERDADVKTKMNPHFKRYSLPGNLVNDDEDLDHAAQRVLKELTNLENIFLEQFYAFGDPNRVKDHADVQWLNSVRSDPKARVITVAYYSLVKLDKYQPSPSSFASNALWVPLESIPELAFDHNRILNKALQTLKLKLRMKPIGFELLPAKFTLGQLQKVYETILGTSLDKRNFRRKILSKGFIKPLSEKQKGVPHKRAQLYEFDQEHYNSYEKETFDFEF